MIDFAPVAFEAKFRDLVGQAAPDDELDAIDDAVHKALKDSDDAKACAHIAAQVLSAADRPWPLAYALNTAVCASCLEEDTQRARLYLTQLVDLTIEHGTDLAALSAAGNVEALLPGRSKADHVPHMLYEVVRLYVHLEKIEKAIENLIIAAHLFADFGAFQPAYRSLAEAEDLARNDALVDQYMDVLTAFHGVCLLEGDHAHAKTVWPSLKTRFATLGRPVPLALLVNQATLLMQTGDLQGARSGFEEALSGMDPTAEGRFVVLINLSACLRDLGERAQSDARMAEARQLLSTIERVDPEHPLEMELIAAKNALLGGEPTLAVQCLHRAVRCLDDAIDLVEKLHYRRGLRERYVPRVERLLTNLPPTGAAEDVLRVVACTRANRVSDWLHFLDWTRALAAKLPAQERDTLDDLVDRLAGYGAPHLYGYREKYDDPMAPTLIPDPWQEVAECADKACARHGVSRPFHGATSGNRAALIAQRLGEGYAVLVNLLSADHKCLLLVGTRYIIGDLPRDETRTYMLALARHRQEPNQTKALGTAVNAYQAALLISLKPLLDELAAEACKGVVFVPDRADLTPINLVMIGDTRIRARMAAGAFEVRTCLALSLAQRHVGSPIRCLGVVERGSDLQHARADVHGFFDGSGAQGTLLEDPSWDEFAAHMPSRDALVLSHHGMSATRFRDPHFVDMAGSERRSAMNLASLQAVSFRWGHRLVVLGTCHSGGMVNRNYQKDFRSHDLMGFPTVFLLNGQSEVLAASWAILDRFNVLLTALFAPGLGESTPARAAGTALAKLVDLPKEALQNLLNRAFPGALEKEPMFLEQMDNLRRQPFCYGAYQTYTLL